MTSKKSFDILVSILIGFSLLLSQVTLADGQAITENWALIGQFGGKTQALTIQDHVVYAGIGSRLAVLNTTNPANLSITGMSTPFHGFVRDIAVSGKIAYVAAGEDGIGIVNATDPAHPIMFGTLDTRGYAEGIAVKGSTVYLADGPYGLRVLDTTILSAPLEIGSAYPFNYAFDVSLAGNYAYIAAGGSGLLVADISDPHHPKEISQVDTPGYAYEVVISGNTAYVADEWEGVAVVDLSNPAHPVRIGKCITPGWALSIALSGTNLYVGNGDSGLRVCDVSNRTSPVDIGSSIGNDGFARRVASDGNLIFIADTVKGIRVINAAGLPQLQQLGLYSTLTDARRATVVGNYAYVAAGFEGGMFILDVTNPANPVRVSHFAMDGGASDVVVSGNYAYLTTISPNTNVITVINIADPIHPTFVAAITAASLCPLCAEPYDLALQGGMAYLADGRGLRIFDISAPSSIHLEGEIAIYAPGSGPIAVAVMGNYAYLANMFDGVEIINISDPSHPQFTANYKGSTHVFARAVAAENNRLYVTNDSTVKIVDVASPAAPGDLGQFDITGDSNGLTIAGNELAVSDGGAGIQVFDVSNPANPTLSASFETLGYALDSFRLGNKLYVSDMYGGLLIFQKQVAAQAGGEAQKPTVQPGGDEQDGITSPILEETGYQQARQSVASLMKRLADDQLLAPPPTQVHLSTASGCTVTTPADGGPGSLRGCLKNASSGTNITFSTTAFPPNGPAAIHLLTPLPPLDDGWVTIDASNAGVILDGGKSIGQGLHIISSHNTIMGLQIINFTQVGLNIDSHVDYNQIGGDRTVGAGPSGQGNVFGADDYGIAISNARYNTIEGNLIGTNASGTAASSERNRFGIAVLSGAFYNQIGGQTPGERNIISGNLWTGIDFFGHDSSWNVVRGNYIGTDVTGTKAISNDLWGILLECGASKNIIGGTTPVERNLISGNIRQGITLTDMPSSQNTVIGNIIGLDSTGTTALPNGTGISVFTTAFNRVGGSNPGEGNIVSGNGTGIHVGGIGQMDAVVMGNQVGGDLYGHPSLGNTIGVVITQGVQHNFIGGLGKGEGNQIQHNATGIEISQAGIKYNWIAGNSITAYSEIAGIFIHQSASHNFIVGNFISGNSPGVRVSSGSYNTVRANSITGNQPFGIWLTEGGNQMLPAPVITDLTEFLITGTACPGCEIELFSDPGDQGLIYEGSTFADQAGNFQYAKRLLGPNVTATATDAAGNTSQFSSPVAIYWIWLRLYVPVVLK